MKHFAAITLVAALLCALLSGCAGTNYGYGYGYDGNVSTTDNGYVNGTNNGASYSNGTNGGYYYNGNGSGAGSGNATGNRTGSATGTGDSGRPTPRSEGSQSVR